MVILKLIIENRSRLTGYRKHSIINMMFENGRKKTLEIDFGSFETGGDG